MPFRPESSFHGKDDIKYSLSTETCISQVFLHFAILKSLRIQCTFQIPHMFEFMEYWGSDGKQYTASVDARCVRIVAFAIVVFCLI